MHEMSLMQSVLRIMQDQAEAQGFTKVKTVWLEIGKLSHVDADAMAFCFDVVVKETLADGAALDIERTPGQAWCLNCSKTVTLEQRFDPCPDCGKHEIQITHGDEMRIKELEVE